MLKQTKYNILNKYQSGNDDVLNVKEFRNRKTRIRHRYILYLDLKPEFSISTVFLLSMVDTFPFFVNLFNKFNYVLEYHLKKEKQFSFVIRFKFFIIEKESSGYRKIFVKIYHDKNGCNFPPFSVFLTIELCVYDLLLPDCFITTGQGCSFVSCQLASLVKTITQTSNPDTKFTLLPYK